MKNIENKLLKETNKRNFKAYEGNKNNDLLIIVNQYYLFLYFYI
jgi:hypothetical protein